LTFRWAHYDDILSIPMQHPSLIHLSAWKENSVKFAPGNYGGHHDARKRARAHRARREGRWNLILSSAHGD
jgi:hypothetical protein